jgi:hypothetical protein
MGSIAGLDAVEKRKIPNSRRESNPSNPNSPARSQSLYRLKYPDSWERQEETWDM